MYSVITNTVVSIDTVIHTLQQFVWPIKNAFDMVCHKTSLYKQN